MKINKIFMALFVISVLMFISPANVNAQENETLNVTDNITVNVTENVTEDITTNVTTNVTLNVTENVTEIVIENVTNVTDITNTTTNVTTNVTDITNTTTNTTNTTQTIEEDELEKDVSAAKYNYGMQVRLLQLQKSIEKQLKIGNLILDEIENQNFDVNTENLQATVDDLTDLSNTIANILDDEIVNQSTQEFVAMRHEANKLTHQFRTELYTILTPAQLKTIKDAIKDDMKVKGPKEAQVESQLRAKVKVHNIEVALKLYDRLGLDNEELRAKIANGELDAKALKDNLKGEFKSLNIEKKNQATNKMKLEKNLEVKEKLQLQGKFKGLNQDDVEDIASDDSLTNEEKQAKIRVLAQKHRVENPNCYNNMLDVGEEVVDCGGNCGDCLEFQQKRNENNAGNGNNNANKRGDR